MFVNDISAAERSVARQFNVGIAAAVHKLDVMLWKSVARLPHNLKLGNIGMRHLEEFAAVLANDALRCEHHHAAVREYERAQAIEDGNEKQKRHHG